MIEVLWSVVLCGSTVAGTWLSPRHWWGWAISFVSEVLWVVYAVLIHSWPVGILAAILTVVNARNTYVTWNAQRRERREPVRSPASAFYDQLHLRGPSGRGGAV